MSDKRFCDADCNNCPLISHPNSKLLSYLFNIMQQQDDSFYKTLNDICPNLTVCYNCRIDDFGHMANCQIEDAAFCFVTDKRNAPDSAPEEESPIGKWYITKNKTGYHALQFESVHAYGVYKDVIDGMVKIFPTELDAWKNLKKELDYNKVKNRNWNTHLDGQIAKGLQSKMIHTAGDPGFNKLYAVPEDKVPLVKELTDISAQIFELSAEVENIKKQLNEVQV